ncbi:ankyrin repeat domain-containing protein [Thioflavicoccus mobilis]|nr:ankyrin repeat domain-containing protein [Thioflavicoccus mobilis]
MARAGHDAHHNFMQKLDFPRRLLILGVGIALLVGCGEQSTDEFDHESAPPLVRAAEQGDISALNALLSGRAEPDVRDACQWTPLMKAALNGHLDAVERLVDAGANLDAKDSGGYTAMMLAASNDHAGIVDYLLTHGAAIDHQEATQGFTALIWAAKLGHAAAVETLLEHGADTDLVDHAGRTAADWATEAGFPEIAAQIEASANG